jgi:hypothetical protein
VPVGDDVAGGERLGETRRAPGRRAGVVNEPDSQPFRLHDVSLRQGRTKHGLVHVPVHRLHGGESLELFQDARRGEVSDMEDEIRLREDANAALRQPAGAAWEMRISDERDQANSGRNSPSRYTSSPSA